MDTFMKRLVLCSILLTGQAYSNKFTSKGTAFSKITGTLITPVDKVEDVLTNNSDIYKDIRRNLTRGVGGYFPTEEWLEYTVTVTQLFLWPSPQKDDGNLRNLSFALLVQNKFNTTPADTPYAESIVKDSLWDHVHEIEADEQGYIKSEGLRISYDDAKNLPAAILQNVTFGYMSFITRLKSSSTGGSNGDGDGDGDGSTSNKTSNGHSFVKTISKEPPEISYIAYIGLTLSMIGLFITMTSICYFRRLRKFRRNQILVHICATIMAGMLLSIISFTYRGDNRGYCTTLALLLHYFILAALSWMCVEAYNLYRDLVKVFNNNVVSTRAFTLRACLFGYGLPALIVCITCSVDISVYGQRNDACWMTSIAFLISFLAPVLLIVLINIVFFSLIMREIVQVSQRDANNIRPSLRAAVSLSVVLGFCWLLAGISTFTTNPFVTYAFVILSSFQGLFIFLFHGIGKQELRDSWKSLPIFNRKFGKFDSTESQGRGKTESTTQDTPQVLKRFSTESAGKLSKELIATRTDSGFNSAACDAGHNPAYELESGLSTSQSSYDMPGKFNVQGVPEQQYAPL